MIYVTGDIHGDYSVFRQKKFRRLSSGDTLIVCGDFGFVWDGSKKEKKILDRLARQKFTICFADGANENFELLNSYPEITFAGGRAHKIRDNIFHFMRGEIFEIEGEKIFVMGGGEGYENDLLYGRDGRSVLETPTAEELRNGLNNLERCSYKVDYIITHEPCKKVKAFLSLKTNEAVEFSLLNTYFQQLSSGCEYTRWFFGSLHEDKFISPSQIAVFNSLICMTTGKEIK